MYVLVNLKFWKIWSHYEYCFEQQQSSELAISQSRLHRRARLRTRCRLTGRGLTTAWLLALWYLFNQTTSYVISGLTALCNCWSKITQWAVSISPISLEITTRRERHPQVSHEWVYTHQSVVEERAFHPHCNTYELHLGCWVVILGL